MSHITLIQIAYNKRSFPHNLTRYILTGEMLMNNISLKYWIKLMLFGKDEQLKESFPKLYQDMRKNKEKKLCQS